MNSLNQVPHKSFMYDEGLPVQMIDLTGTWNFDKD